MLNYLLLDKSFPLTGLDQPEAAIRFSASLLMPISVAIGIDPAVNVRASAGQQTEKSAVAKASLCVIRVHCAAVAIYISERLAVSTLPPRAD